MSLGGTLKATASMVGDKWTIPYRHVAAIKAQPVGVREGYRIHFMLEPELAKRGLIAANAPGNFQDETVEVVCINAGREIIQIDEGAALGEYWYVRSE